MLGSNILIIAMMLLPKQLRTFLRAMEQPGQWAAHFTTGVDIPAACYTCTETLSHKLIKAKWYQNRKPTGKKDIISTGNNLYRRKGKKEAPKCCEHFPIYTCYFQRVTGPKKFASVGFKKWQRPCSLKVLAATRCKHHATMYNVQMIISRYCEYRPLAGLSFRKSEKATNLQASISKCCACHAVYQ